VQNLNPRIALILETEIWPNLFARLDRQNVPLLLVNARLSLKSLNGYRKFPALITPAIDSVTRIAARSEQDAEHFRELGADNRQLLVSGDLKLDCGSPADTDTRIRVLRGRIGERPVWVAGSTHAGEESMLLEAHRRVLQQHPDVLLVMAPRHPERSPQLVNLCRHAGLHYSLFTGPESVAGSEQVLILDVLGELVFLYGVALVAFIGGSLVERGGHNPVEAAVAGAALASGPAYSNFMAIYQALTAAGAVKLVDGTAELAAFVVRCLDNPGYRRQLVEASLKVVNENRGAVARTMVLLEEVIPPAAPVGAVA
jgi:3-deoxy-D-manno-octulosonic-acid transferase